MATSKYKAYRNLLVGTAMLFFTVMFLKDHFFPGGRDLDDLIYLQESGAETKATITNFDELEQGKKTLKFTYVVKGETYRGFHTLRGKLNPIELLAPVTYNLRRPNVHQFNLRGALERAERQEKSSLSWKFYPFPIGAFLMLYWGFGDLRKLKEEARTQDANEG